MSWVVDSWRFLERRQSMSKRIGEFLGFGTALLIFFGLLNRLVISRWYVNLSLMALLVLTFLINRKYKKWVW